MMIITCEHHTDTKLVPLSKDDEKWLHPELDTIKIKDRNPENWRTCPKCRRIVYVKTLKNNSKTNSNEYRDTISFCRIKDQPCSWVWSPKDKRVSVEDCSNCLTAKHFRDSKKRNETLLAQIRRKRI